ncbi:MAG: polysaccharide biosynthesis C-terminal domain-containing protein [Deltaproteobacteria bacterium]|nr:polysaccharide biosynthesis C-terminal domain-containing protein [Deltaproteobacteria bacterium]
MNDQKSDASIVKAAGRGVIYITFAKAWFLITGVALGLVLPRVFKWSAGSEEAGMALYGAYGIVFTGVSFINNTLITGTIQAVSKFTSEDESRAGAVRRTGLLVQGGIGVVLGAAYAVLSGVLATYWFKSPGLADLMRLSAGIIVAYACYGVFIGSFNGRRRFNRQAAFDVTFSTLKTVLIILAVMTGLKVLGTVLGFLVTAVLVAVVAGVASRQPVHGTFPARRFLQFDSLLLLYTFILNLVLMLDLYLLAGIVPRLAAASGLDATAAALLNETRAGQYKAVQQLAFIPYQAILAIAFVVFPLISKATFDEDEEKACGYVRQTMRFAAIFVTGFAVVFFALPEQAARLMFPPEYAIIAPALRTLSLGIVAFGLMVVGNTILNGSGHPWRALAVVCAGLAVAVVTVYALVSAAGHGTDSLVAAASGSSAGWLVALVVCGVIVRRRFGAFMPLFTALRVAAAAGVALAVGRFLPVKGKVLTLAECAAVFVVYFVVLALLREFGRKDLDQLKHVMRRGK